MSAGSVLRFGLVPLCALGLRSTPGSVQAAGKAARSTASPAQAPSPTKAG